MQEEGSPCLSRIQLERVVQFPVEETDFSFVLCRGAVMRLVVERGREEEERETNQFRQIRELQSRRLGSIRRSRGS